MTFSWWWVMALAVLAAVSFFGHWQSNMRLRSVLRYAAAAKLAPGVDRSKYVVELLERGGYGGWRLSKACMAVGIQIPAKFRPRSS